MAGRAVGFDPADDAENQILRADARAEFSIDANLKRLRTLFPQALRREHVLDFAGADSERERAERAVRRGMAVAANDRHARLREPKLRPDNVHDPLLARSDIEQTEPELRAVAPQRLDLQFRIGVGDRLAAIGRRHVVILRRVRPMRRANFATRMAQALERLRRRDFMHQVKVDVEQRRFVLFFADYMLFPDFFEQGFCSHCVLNSSRIGGVKLLV